MSNEPTPVALVTGGSRGIGQAVVHRLARDGYKVAFCYQSRPDAAERCSEGVEKASGIAVATRVDVSDSAQVRSWVSATEKELGPIQVVVTSAGIVRDNVLLSMSDADWNDVIDTNLGGAFNVCRAAVFPLLKRRSGSIINVSSVSGIHGNIGQTNYSASKAGVIGFTKSLAKEVGPYGVRANVVAPGFIETDMTSAVSESVRKLLLDRIPLRRWGAAEDVAELVSFLASPRSKYMTAGVFQIDGGLSL